MASAAGGAKAGWKEWVGLVILMLPVLIVSITVTGLFFALPSLAAELSPSAAQQLWIVDIYTFVLAGLLIPMGALGDRIGMRRLLFAGSAAFAVTSAIAAYAPTAELLIAMRALQGAAAATLMPPTLALIRSLFRDTRQRQMAMALWATMLSVGSVIGPIAGGWMLEHFWWGAVFLLNVPFMLLLLATGPLLLPETRGSRHGEGFDLLSGVLILLTVLPIVYAVKQIAAEIYTAPVWIAIVVGLFFGVLFVRRQRRLSDPMLDLELFRRKSFSVSLIAAGLTLFALVGTTYFVTQYLMLVLEMRPFIAGVMTLPAAGGSVLGAMLGAALTRRIRPGFVVGSGLVVMSGGFLLLTQLAAESNLPLLFSGMALIGWGIGSVSALASDMVVASAPREKAGSASAVFESAVEFGGALGAAVLGSIGVAIYRNSLSGSLPQGLPDEAAAAARETLGGALSAALRLPEELAGGLVTAAREAFVDGTQAAAVAGALLTLAMGILAMVYLRNTRIAEENPDPDDSTAIDGTMSKPVQN